MMHGKRLSVYNITYLFGACLAIMFFLVPLQTEASTFSDEIVAASATYNVPPALVAAIMKAETGFDPNRISSSGCAGLGQICIGSDDETIFPVVCRQTGSSPSLCRPTACTGNLCETCTGSQAGCVPDTRFDVSRGILGAAEVVSSKSDALDDICDLSSEAGVKAVAFAYNSGQRFPEHAVADLGNCDNYTEIWTNVLEHWAPTPASCSSDSDCGTGTCSTENLGSVTANVCKNTRGETTGEVTYGGWNHDITLDKLNRKTDTYPGSYVSKIYTAFLEFGGDTPNTTFESLSVGASASGVTAAEVRALTAADIKIPSPKISIPGLTFSPKEDLLVTDSDGSQYLTVPYLAEYLAAIYRIAMGFIIVLATIGTITGGIIIMVSPAQRANGSKLILAGVAGVTLAAGSYTLLFIINPDLVNLKSLRVQVVAPEPLSYNTYLRNTLVDTTGFGTSDYSGITTGEWSATLTACPVNMAPLDPEASSRETNTYNNQLYAALRTQISELPFSPTPSQRAVLAAEMAWQCQARFGSCGRTIGTIHSIAGSDPSFDNCTPRGEGSDCGDNEGDEIWSAGGINRAFQYGQNCGTEQKNVSNHVRNNYASVDPEIDGTYPRGDCVTDRSVARQRVHQFFQQQASQGQMNDIVRYPDDILMQLQPGDHLTYYNGNSSLVGSHAVLFLGWSDDGKAQVISGSSSRAARPHSACLRSDCGDRILPITGVYRPF